MEGLTLEGGGGGGKGGGAWGITRLKKSVSKQPTQQC